MANQFSFNDAIYFSFNGINSKTKNLRMQTIGDNNSLILIGLNREPKEEDGVRDINVFKGVKDNYNEVPITIVKGLKDGTLLPFTDEDIFEINRWLFSKKEYLPFYTDKSDLQYYVLFTKSEGDFNFANEGYINLTMKCLPTAYSPIIHRKELVEGSLEFQVLNKTDIDNKIVPDIVVKMKEGNSFKITNVTNGTVFEINNLADGELFHVLGDRRFIFSQVDSKRNLYKLCNKTFMHMNFGRNVIKVECNGKCEIELIHQMRMGWGR